MQRGIDKNVCFVDLGWRVLEMFIKFTCSGSEFKSWISLLIFCLVELSNTDNVMIKSPTINGSLSLPLMTYKVIKNLLYVSGCPSIGCVYI